RVSAWRWPRATVPATSGREARPSSKKLLRASGLYLGWSCISWRQAVVRRSRIVTNTIVGRTPPSAPDAPVRLLLGSSRPTRGSAAGQGACPTKSAGGLSNRKSVRSARNFAHLPRRQAFQEISGRYFVKHWV